MDTSLAPERGTARSTRLVDSVWARGALALALVEGILVAVGVIPRWVAVGVAVAALVAYFLRARHAARPTVRQAAWALALSQAIVLFVPLVLWILGAVVVVALAALAAIVLVVLLVDR